MLTNRKQGLSIRFAVEDRFVVLRVSDEQYWESETGFALVDVLANIKTESPDLQFIVDLRSAAELSDDKKQVLLEFQSLGAQFLLPGWARRTWDWFEAPEHANGVRWLRKNISEVMNLRERRFLWNRMNVEAVSECVEPIGFDTYPIYSSNITPREQLVTLVYEIQSALKAGRALDPIVDSYAPAVSRLFGKRARAADVSEAILQCAARLPRLLGTSADQPYTAQATQGLDALLDAMGVRYPPLPDPEVEQADLLLQDLATEAVKSQLRLAHRRSVLAEFVIQVDGDRLTCVPYHAGALFDIEAPGQRELLVGRPAIVARQAGAVLRTEADAFEELINRSRVKELEIQKFLDSHPSFLRGLGYQNVYSQVVLAREDGSSLRPDYILEPVAGDWCDVVDIKLPYVRTTVGRSDRRALAAAVHEAAAQLREYRAYFEDPKHRRHVLERYGLRVYRPRMIVIIGRDVTELSDAELRRAMTAYEDLTIVTFDKLARVAQTRLLI